MKRTKTSAPNPNALEKYLDRSLNSSRSLAASRNTRGSIRQAPDILSQSQVARSAEGLMPTYPSNLASFLTKNNSAHQLPDILAYGDDNDGQHRRNKSAYKKSVDELWRSRNEEHTLNTLDLVKVQESDATANDKVWILKEGGFRNCKFEPPTFEQVDSKELHEGRKLLFPAERRKQVEMEKKTFLSSQHMKRTQGDRDRLVRLVGNMYPRGVMGSEDLQTGEGSEIYGERHRTNLDAHITQNSRQERRRHYLAQQIQKSDQKLLHEDDDTRVPVFRTSRKRVPSLTEKHWSSTALESLLTGNHTQLRQNPRRMERIHRANNPRPFDIINNSDISTPPFCS